VEAAVYILCAGTALLCAVLLLRGYRNSGARLLLWCGLFFVAMTAENVILFIDLEILSDQVSLLFYRRAVALGGAIILIYGLSNEI
jgi:hypothetical protein